MKEATKTTQELRKFGLTMTVAFGLIATLLWYTGSTAFVYLLGVSIFFLLAAAAYPKVLLPIEKYWMIFGEKISVVMTTIILSLTFYLLMTPLGLFLKLIRKDILGLKIDKNLDSYWQRPEDNGPNSRPLKPY